MHGKKDMKAMHGKKGMKAMHGKKGMKAMHGKKGMKAMHGKMDMKAMHSKNSMQGMKARDGMKGMAAMKMKPMQGGTPPADARDPYASADGYEYRGMGGWEETDEMTIQKLMIDQLEFRQGDQNNVKRWDIQGWRGTDYDRFWFKLEGNDTVSKSGGELELQTLYSKAVSAFWDAQVGIRFDRAYGAGNSENRYFGVVGFQGLAPYWFDMEPAVFVDKDGNLSARVVATYDVLFSQRLILQPRAEINLSANNLPRFGIGKGINDVQFGFRLRYEFRREIAPYIGVSWQKKYGDTATFASIAGDVVEDTKFIAGIRLWF